MRRTRILQCALCAFALFALCCVCALTLSKRLFVHCNCVRNFNARAHNFRPLTCVLWAKLTTQTLSNNTNFDFDLQFKFDFMRALIERAKKNFDQMRKCVLLWRHLIFLYTLIGLKLEVKIRSTKIRCKIAKKESKL